MDSAWFQLLERSGATLSLFWALGVTAAFNLSYAFFLRDGRHRGLPTPSPGRRWMIVFLGTLVVVGTYADTLAKLTFELKHCILLAFVAAHGWMADEMVERFLQTVRGADLTAATPGTRNP